MPLFEQSVTPSALSTSVTCSPLGLHSFSDTAHAAFASPTDSRPVGGAVGGGGWCARWARWAAAAASAAAPTRQRRSAEAARRSISWSVAGSGAVSGTRKKVTVSARAKRHAASSGGAARPTSLERAPPNAGPSTKPQPTIAPSFDIARIRPSGAVQSATSARATVRLCLKSPIGSRDASKK